MIKTKISICLIVLSLLCSCAHEKKDYISFVNPLIGTGGHGHVFVGASVPHGMIQLGPNNDATGWDWCSGYHDSDSTILGFAHSHLSGTGIADLGDVLFMPAVGVPTAADSLPTSVYVSTFAKSRQNVRPGYYAVTLDRNGVRAELTANDRAAFHRYTFPKGKEAMLVIDLVNGVKSIPSRRGVTDASLSLTDGDTVSGFRASDEWAAGHKVWFSAVFSEPVRDFKVFEEGDGKKALLSFGYLDKPLGVTSAISYTDAGGASVNLKEEGIGRDFDSVAEEAAQRWNDALSVIDFEAPGDARRIFYTALYHTMISPSLFSDADGRFRGADGEIHKADSFVPYTVFSLWDTYRAVHPLYTLIDTHTSDYVNSLIDISARQRALPVWHLVGNETECMVGVHSIPVIVDACLKGVPGIDRAAAAAEVARIDSMTLPGLPEMRTLGYIPADKVPWSVARGLEYAIDDYAAALLAKDDGRDSDYTRYIERSRNYRHYFDPATGFMRGLLSDGTRRDGFDPSYSLHMEDDYVEGNAWQYTWLVPHDPQGLIGLFGGREPFVAKLDSLFTADSALNEGASADITGMIGQYAHGNEPGHHIIYLYTVAGEPRKAADRLHEVYDSFYTTAPDGLIGNEDCGQMSAWYIFSALGFYPLDPAGGKMVFGSPIASKASLKLINGKRLDIVVHRDAPDARYIKAVRFNGEPHDTQYITYDELAQGGLLEIETAN